MRKIVLALVIAVALPLAAACGGDDGEPEATPTPASTPTATATATAATPAATPTPGPIVVTDARGEQITLKRPATRVVCLTGLCVDTLFVLGMKPVAANDALHKHPAYWGPGESEIAPIGGSFREPSIEDIAKARPDIVIGLVGIHDGMRASLKDIAPLYIVNPIGVDGMLKHVAEIGRMVGKGKEAEQASEAFTKRVEEAAQKIKTKKSVLVIFGSDIRIGVETTCTPTVDTLNRVANYAFMFEACARGEFPSFSLEQLLRINPDVVFVMTLSFGPTPTKPVSEQLAENALWKQLNAVKNGQVHEVSFAVWATSRGIRGSAVVLEEALPKIYPDVFTATQR